MKKCSICGDEVHSLVINETNLINDALPDNHYKCMKCLTIIYGTNEINSICKKLDIHRWVDFYSYNSSCRYWWCNCRVIMGYDNKIVTSQWADGSVFKICPTSSQDVAIINELVEKYGE